MSILALIWISAGDDELTQRFKWVLVCRTLPTWNYRVFCFLKTHSLTTDLGCLSGQCEKVLRILCVLKECVNTQLITIQLAIELIGE